MKNLLISIITIFSLTSYGHDETQMSKAEKLVLESRNNNRKEELTERLNNLMKKEGIDPKDGEIVFSTHNSGLVSNASIIFEDTVCDLVPGIARKWQYNARFFRATVTDPSKDELNCTILNLD